MSQYRQVLQTAIANGCNKASGFVLLLISIPLTFPYLGAERFGIWMTISSLAAMLTLFDLGIGNSILNAVSREFSTKSSSNLVDTISNGLLLLCGLGAFLGLLFLVVNSFITWERFFQVADINKAELDRALEMFIILFSLNLPARAITNVYLGIQKGHVPHVLGIVANGVSLVALYFITRAEGGIPLLIASTLGLQTVSSLIGAVLLMNWGYLRGASIGYENIKKTGSALVKPGMAFFYLQAGAMVAWGMDSLLIASTLGVSSVAIFAVTHRLFQLVTLPIATLVGPLWAVYARSLKNGEIAFVTTTLRRSLFLSAVLAISGSVVLFSGGEWLVGVWTDESLIVPSGLLLGFSIWVVIEAVGNTFAMFLNGAGIFRPQIIVVTAFVLIALPLKWFLLPVVDLDGFMFISISCYLLTVAVPYMTILKPSWRMKLTPETP